MADFFLSKLLGQASASLDVHHLASLDPVLHKNLLYLRHYDGDVSELGLDFTIVSNELGETRVRTAFYLLFPVGILTVTVDFYSFSGRGTKAGWGQHSSDIVKPNRVHPLGSRLQAQ